MNHDISYLIANKIIIELNVIFEIYDKIVKLNIKFHDPHFAINNKNKKKIFEIFYAHFNVVIASLNYSNILKIFNLKRLINTRLKYRIFNENFNIFKKLVTRLRHVVVNLKIIDKINSKKNKIEDSQNFKRFDE